MRRVVALVGPTGSGKTALSLALAQRFGMQVVNTDSGLFYRELRVGVAKPQATDMRAARHHLVDFLTLGQSYSLAQYLEVARKTIDQLNTSGQIPLVVGGSGQYVWALLEGWLPTRTSPTPQLRQTLESQLKQAGLVFLAERLRELNPQLYAVTDIRNPRRVVRALERAISSPQAEKPSKPSQPPYSTLILGLAWERSQLHRRLDERLKRMLNDGWVDEVRELVGQGAFDKPAPPMMIGYRELASHIKGETSLEVAKQAIRVATHRLVRHQHNWFKPADKRIMWLEAQSCNLVKQAVQAIETFRRT